MRKGRKVSGGRYKKQRKKRLHELPGQGRIVKLGEEKRKSVKVTGGNIKTFLFKGKFINLVVSGKSKKVEIKNVIETPSNKFLARQNVITRGTIVETTAGRARVTNRPSQEGSINGVLVQ